ncbi:L,D-transpeptidase family protein [Sphingomonas sp. GCM10030256]|uniref:L,D-transpeptidase family protein n=1 Tax=Sphingomonas sp. GCM10030256 TaxID=3273427 RepID=UPI00361AD9A7
MRLIRKGMVVAVGAALLAGCSTTPPPPPPVVAQPKPQELPYRWTQGNAPQAHKDSLALFGPVSMKPGDYYWASAMPESGEAKVVIDLLTQRFYIYRGDKLAGMSTISSGKKGHETPLGFWKIFRKQVKGFSRKYDNAPMPYMQMYDEMGIAFHGGKLPGYPASHGCVRLPVEFAKKLYGLTKLGTEVIIEG